MTDDENSLSPVTDDLPPASEPPPEVVFEDLTLAEALRYFIWRPGQTGRLFWQVLTREADRQPVPVRVPVPRAALAPAPVPAVRPAVTAVAEAVRLTWETWINLVALAIVVLLALRGGYVLHEAALDPAKKAINDTDGAFFWFQLAGIGYLGLELWVSRHRLARRAPRRAGALRARFRANELPQLWISGLLVPLVGLLSIAILTASLPLKVLLIALAALLWAVLVVGSATSGAEGAAGDSDAGEVRAALGEVAPPPDPYAPDQPGESPASAPALAEERGFWAWFGAHVFQLLLIPPALLCSSWTYTLNVSHDPLGRVNDVVLTSGGSLAWALAIVLWALVLGVDLRRLWAVLLREPHLTWRWPRLTWPLVALLGAIVLGAAFRFHDFSAVPPEMTSDHIEKLRDALRVSEGYYPVFFANNGGREAFQMYFLAFLGDTLGLGFSFDTLKLATVLEGLVTLLALWWMARQVIGTATPEDRHLGTWVGVALAGLVAVNSWHLMLSRLGLRIVLTPLTTALVIGLLARAMRRNRMDDYVLLGITLGAGTYLYQANRMLPILVGIGIGLALLGTIRRPRDVFGLLGNGIGLAALAAAPLLALGYLARVLQDYANSAEFGGQLETALPLLAIAWFGLLALAVRGSGAGHDRALQSLAGLLAVITLAMVLYIPMYHYSNLYPEEYWNRTRGRLFGDQAFVRVDPASGETVAYEPSLREQADRVWERRSVLVENYKVALKMYHWDGDGAWISNAWSHPALDAVAGGLLMLGAVVWGAWALRRGDAALWLLPAGVLVMLLPSALTLAFLNENPNFTRGSGTLPPIFMLAALPFGLLLAWLARLPLRVGPAHLGGLAAMVVLAGVLWNGAGWDRENFFTDYRLQYAQSWKPYHAIAKPLREFAQGEGSYGNAFVIAWTHWLDHRILGAVAGDVNWPNGVPSRGELVPMIERNRSTPYEYDPGKPLFIMYYPEDVETAAMLASIFPGGETVLYQYRYEAGYPGQFLEGEFYIYRVWAGDFDG